MFHIHTENRAGKPIIRHGYKIIPIERSFQLQPPGMWGVLRWKRPHSVVIQHSDGSEHVLIIKDRSRHAQLLLLAFGLFGSILLLLLNSIIKAK